MAININDLDKKLWKELKKNAGLKNSKWFKKADGAVGKHIEAMTKARDKFEKGGYLAKDLLKYQEALEALDTAFDKFCSKKELDDIDDGDLKADEKKKLAKEIEEWRDQIDKTVLGVKKGVQTLLKAVNNDFEKLDSAEASKRKVIMEKTFDTFIL